MTYWCFGVYYFSALASKHIPKSDTLVSAASTSGQCVGFPGTPCHSLHNQFTPILLYLIKAMKSDRKKTYENVSTKWYADPCRWKPILLIIYAHLDCCLVSFKELGGLGKTSSTPDTDKVVICATG